MSKSAYKRYQWIQQQLETDEEYLSLERDRVRREAELNRILETLPREQQAVITDYLGICAEEWDRMLELACFAEEDERTNLLR